MEAELKLAADASASEMQRAIEEHLTTRVARMKTDRVRKILKIWSNLHSIVQCSDLDDVKAATKGAMSKMTKELVSLLYQSALSASESLSDAVEEEGRRRCRDRSPRG